MILKSDFYDILHVDKKASIAEIKTSYRELALRYHPDVNPDGREHFEKIKIAYETLSNPQLRYKYDTVSSSEIVVDADKYLNDFFMETINQS